MRPTASSGIASTVVTIIDVESNTSCDIIVVKEGELPIKTIQDIFGLSNIQLPGQGILSYDARGFSNVVTFKFGDTIEICGDKVPHVLTQQILDKLEKHNKELREIKQCLFGQAKPTASFTCCAIESWLRSFFKKK